MFNISKLLSIAKIELTPTLGFILNIATLIVVVGSIVLIAKLINKSIDKKQQAKDKENK